MPPTSLLFLSGNGKPTVSSLSAFNTTEYFVPDRRFLLGAVTYYEGPKVWALENAPYDTASLELISTRLTRVRGAAFFGQRSCSAPRSENIQSEVTKLPPEIPVLTTAQLYEGIDYQPLTSFRPSQF